MSVDAPMPASRQCRSRVDLELIQRDKTTVQQVIVAMDEVAQLCVLIDEDDRDRQMVGHVENPRGVDVTGAPESLDAAQDGRTREPGLVSSMHDDVAQRLVVVNGAVAHIDGQLARSLEAAHNRRSLAVVGGPAHRWSQHNGSWRGHELRTAGFSNSDAQQRGSAR